MNNSLVHVRLEIREMDLVIDFDFNKENDNLNETCRSLYEELSQRYKVSNVVKNFIKEEIQKQIDGSNNQSTRNIGNDIKNKATTTKDDLVISKSGFEINNGTINFIKEEKQKNMNEIINKSLKNIESDLNSKNLLVGDESSNFKSVLEFDDSSDDDIKNNAEYVKLIEEQEKKIRELYKEQENEVSELTKGHENSIDIIYNEGTSQMTLEFDSSDEDFRTNIDYLNLFREHQNKINELWKKQKEELEEFEKSFREQYNSADSSEKISVESDVSQGKDSK